MSAPSPRVYVRPIATPLPLGFLALTVATFAFSALQLGWVPQAQGSTIALCVLVFTVPLQVIASVTGFLARDPVAATGMGILAGAWAAATLATMTSPPGSSVKALGIVLLAAAAALLVPAVAAVSKMAAAAVMLLSVVRFAVTGVAELSGSPSWLTAAGWVGVALAVVALYAALAFEIEGVQQRDVLPIGRRGGAEAAFDPGDPPNATEVSLEPGVREQL